MNKNNLFIEESLPDESYKIVWQGKNGINDIAIALDKLKTIESDNRLELWSKSHAETSNGYIPMAYRMKYGKVVLISNTLKMLMGPKCEFNTPHTIGEMFLGFAK